MKAPRFNVKAQRLDAEPLKLSDTVRRALCNSPSTIDTGRLKGDISARMFCPHILDNSKKLSFFAA
uniref:Uncharacterized protein n=1 Tax=Candidatus Kentrum sp. TUN TaxID=2126343 RepID=A0A450ZCX9_9GAMM|nr:MAG: hypothetical protein BECKTUN1418E_GA0071001_100630 [Candidatus Kentron sp. TUN]